MDRIVSPARGRQGRNAAGDQLRPPNVAGSSSGAAAGARRGAGGSRHLVACAVFLAATFVVFGDVLFSGGGRLLSKDGEDLANVILFWEQFGFDELKKGNLALWNPHVFSGTPFLGGFQPALLYPPNWMHLILPLATAINVGIAFHFFLAGLWTYLWTSYRRLHTAACIFAGLMFMSGGAYFLQIYRGHLPNLRTIVWAPLILLAVDGLLETSAIGWLLLGSVAIAMQILAGHVQYVFYTAVVVAIYAGLRWIMSARRLRTAGALLALYPLGASLSAIQLLPGLDAVSESLRSGLSYEIARTFAFPPENVLTLILPGVFGDMMTTPYWGRWTLSEISLHIGMTGFLLVVYGIVHGEKTQKRSALAMALIALVLSFGYYTLLFRLLYDYVPGFASFRGISKCAVLASLFLAMLGAVGLDRVLTAPRLPRWPLAAALSAGAVLVVSGLAIQRSAVSTDGEWARMLRAINWADEAFGYYPAAHTTDAIQRYGRHAAESLFWAGGTAFALAGLWVAMRYSRLVAYGMAILGSIELFTYALSSRPTFDSRPAMRYVAAVRDSLPDKRGDYRILGVNPYVAMSAGLDHIWGYDPMILGRYARFIASTQAMDPDLMMVSGGLRRASPLLSMIRLRYLFWGEAQHWHWEPFASPIKELPRALLVSRWRVFPQGRDMLAAMSEPAFDPHEIVFLETDPDPAPVESESRGSVSVVDLSTDVMEIRAELPQPAILVITDNYSRGWRVTPFEGEERQQYAVMPANYTLRAIALGAGTHHLRLEYAPLSFIVGKWVTLLSLLGCAVTGTSLCWRRIGRVKRVRSTVGAGGVGARDVSRVTERPRPPARPRS